MHISFVLLAESVDLDLDATVATFARLFPDSPGWKKAVDDNGDEILESSEGETYVIAALMPGPVPDAEAEQVAECSLGTLADPDSAVTEHKAHLIVTSPTVEGVEMPRSLLDHTRLVAAVASAHNAVGVYEGNACATHTTQFYVEVASESELPVPLWTGLSVAGDDDGRIEILTLGLGQLALPDMLVSSSGDANDSLAFLLDLVAYVIERGEALPDGDTVGRSDEEKLTVNYVESPVDPDLEVARVDLPAVH